MSQYKDDADAMGPFEKHLRGLRPRIAANCPPAENLAAYVDNELAEKEARALKEHFDLCPVCLDALQQLRNARDTAADSESLAATWPKVEADMDAKVYSYLDTLATSESEAGTGETGTSLLSRLKTFIDNLRLPFAPVYAGLAMVVLLVSLYSFAFLSRPATFAVAQIELPSTASFRGPAGQADLFKKGLTSFNAEHYQRAIETFIQYLQENPEHYSANFYLGVSYLASAKTRLLGMPYQFNSKRVEQGIEYLNEALALATGNAFYIEDCLWYLGKASLMLGRVDEAKQRFQSLLGLPQPDLLRKSLAREILQDISDLREAAP